MSIKYFLPAESLSLQIQFVKYIYMQIVVHKIKYFITLTKGRQIKLRYKTYTLAHRTDKQC